MTLDLLQHINSITEEEMEHLRARLKVVEDEARTIKAIFKIVLGKKTAKKSAEEAANNPSTKKAELRRRIGALLLKNEPRLPEQLAEALGCHISAIESAIKTSHFINDAGIVSLSDTGRVIFGSQVTSS